MTRTAKEDYQARLCRHHKLRVLIGGWWRKANRPPAHDIFLDYDHIPREPRIFLEKYETNPLPQRLSENERTVTSLIACVGLRACPPVWDCCVPLRGI